MLIYLPEVNEIVNTDFIIQVIATSRQVQHLEDQLLNLKPDEPYKDDDIITEECCCLIIQGGQEVILGMTVEDFWNLIQSKI